MRNQTLPRRRLAVVGLLLMILGTACGRARQPDEQRIAELLKIGALMLSAAAVKAVGGYGPEYLYDTEWYPENDISRIDEERFPNWAETEYQICMYWQGAYSTKHRNPNRTPENPAVTYDRFGTARGWILVGDDGTHFLELSYGYDDEGEEGTTVAIDAWGQPEEQH